MNESIDIQQIAEVLELEGAFAEASREVRQSLREDPEWRIPQWSHLKTIVEGFAVGVILADPWHKGYRVPPHFEQAVNFVAAKAQERWPNDEMAEASLWEIEGFYRSCVESSPEILAWNESADGNFVTVVSRYSATPDHRDFIDLEALIRNCSNTIRDWRRRDAEFDRKFEEEYGPLSPPQTA